MDARIRAARARDLPACARLFVRSLRDLVRRMGESPPRIHPREVLPFLRHALATDPDGFHVAVHRGRIVCFGISVLRGKTHFLAQFFALPGLQGRGVGRRVLDRVFQVPRVPRGAVRCVVASPDVRAQALYLKFGMLPRTTIYTMSGRPREVRAARPIELRPIGAAGRLSPRAIALAARYDVAARGARREEDYRFWFSRKGTRMYEARLRGRTVGFIVIRGDGVIGPGAVRDESLSEGLIATAIAQSRSLGHRRVSVWVPGLNAGALRAAFAAGLKTEFTTSWMSSREIGDLAAYVPSGGLLF